MSIGGKMNGGNPKGERVKNDAYDTPEGTTRALIPILKKLEWPIGVWECACGSGRMARPLADAGYQVTGTDLVPRGYGMRLNYLNANTPQQPSVVTNPPFSLAEDFIVQTLVFLGIDYLALVLPLNFWCAKGRFNMRCKLPPALEMPHTWRLDTSGEKKPAMSSMWVIWHPRMLRANEGATITHPITSTEKHPGRYDDAT